jgi:hypothetical protein
MLLWRHRHTQTRGDATGRTIVSGAFLALFTATACAPPALVALPSTSSHWIDAFSAKSTNVEGVTVTARTRGWSGPPLDTGGAATPILVHIDNRSGGPLRIARDSFELVAGTRRFRALPPDRIGAAPADLQRRELASRTLGPGESESGFIYFEPVEGRWGFLRLRTSLIDASSNRLLDTVDVPFSSGEVVSCTLDGVASEETSSDRDILFRTCLLPQGP